MLGKSHVAHFVYKRLLGLAMNEKKFTSCSESKYSIVQLTLSSVACRKIFLFKFCLLSVKNCYKACHSGNHAMVLLLI